MKITKTAVGKYVYSSRQCQQNILPTAVNYCHTFRSKESKLMFTCCCSREHNHVIGLMKRFPNLDLEAVKEQFPSVDIEKIRYSKKTRGHHENIC
jgi:hypothetical protein